MEQFDTLNGVQIDLSNPEGQASLKARVSAGVWVYFFITPPCDTWSRVLWSNSWGPCPVRDPYHLLGFPWLVGSAAERVANILRAVSGMKIFRTASFGDFKGVEVQASLFCGAPWSLVLQLETQAGHSWQHLATEVLADG